MVIKAAIFDWDGLLADTEPCWSQADQKWLANNHVTYSDELKSELTGRGQVDCVRTLMEFGHLDLPVDEAIEQRLEALDDIYKTCGDILLPGALDIVRNFYEDEYFTGIASGSSQRTLDSLVKKQRLDRFFNEIMSSDQVSNGKPAPDVYLAVAKRLNVNPSSCLVFEDAQNGIEAAKSAGMYCVAIPNQYTIDQDHSKADLILPNLNAFKLECIMEYFP
ncbi:HAD family phosphatase [Candidatus Pacearchaeota archaeon]|nr:HAD family phosphatase [Candidatus Pacearchaeota archaeon]